MRVLYDKNDNYVSIEEYEDYCEGEEIEPTEDGYYEYSADMEQEYYDDALAECSRLFKGKVKMNGNVQRWDGDTAISTIKLPDIDTALDACISSGEEIVKIIFENDNSLWVAVEHHDGTNYFTIMNAE